MTEKRNIGRPTLAEDKKRPRISSVSVHYKVKELLQKISDERKAADLDSSKGKIIDEWAKAANPKLKL